MYWAALRASMGACLCIPERFAMNESGYQQRAELHKREAVCFQEQLQGASQVRKQQCRQEKEETMYFVGIDISLP